jgi:hypothetical protein
MENFCRRSMNRSRSRSPDRSRAQRGEAGAAAATVKFRSRWTVESNRSLVAQMKNEEVTVVRIVGVVRVVRVVRVVSVVSVVGVVSPPCPSLRALGCWSGNLRFLAGCPPPDLKLRGGGGAITYKSCFAYIYIYIIYIYIYIHHD